MPSIVTKSPKRVGALPRLEAAKYVGISTRKLDDLATAGEIPRVKIGSKTVFRTVDLDNFLNRNMEVQK